MAWSGVGSRQGSAGRGTSSGPISSRSTRRRRGLRHQGGQPPPASPQVRGAAVGSGGGPDARVDPPRRAVRRPLADSPAGNDRAGRRHPGPGPGRQHRGARRRLGRALAAAAVPGRGPAGHGRPGVRGARFGVGRTARPDRRVEPPSRNDAGGRLRRAGTRGTRRRPAPRDGGGQRHRRLLRGGRHAGLARRRAPFHGRR